MDGVLQGSTLRVKRWGEGAARSAGTPLDPGLVGFNTVWGREVKTEIRSK